MDLQMLKCFIASEIEETIQHFSIDRYAWLRSLTVVKLTLFNARREEETSRMMLSECERLREMSGFLRILLRRSKILLKSF
jgi:hypothetical protein